MHTQRLSGSWSERNYTANPVFVLSTREVHLWLKGILAGSTQRKENQISFVRESSVSAVVSKSYLLHVVNFFYLILPLFKWYSSKEMNAYQPKPYLLLLTTSVRLYQKIGHFTRRRNLLLSSKPWENVCEKSRFFLKLIIKSDSLCEIWCSKTLCT